MTSQASWKDLPVYKPTAEGDESSPEWQSLPVYEMKQPKESKIKSAGRDIYQFIAGALKRWTFPADIVQLLGIGEALDPLFIDELREIHEREGIPFDEKEYRKKVEQASKAPFTQSNIEEAIEESTGLPLTPKNKRQRLERLSGEAFGFKGGSIASKLTAGLTAPIAEQGLEALGVPEEVAEPSSLLLSGAPEAIAKNATKAVKPSGIPKRGFEKLDKPKSISEGKFTKINKKIDSDFQNAYSKIIEGKETNSVIKSLQDDPFYKQSVTEMFDDANNAASKLKKRVPPKFLKDEIRKQRDISTKGFVESDYEKTFKNQLNDFIDKLPLGDISAPKLVEQFRKNNKALEEYFEPGASKALNRGKRDALLAENRAIAETIQKFYPKRQLPSIFKESNERWSKIMDAEKMSDFVSDLTSDKGINFKKIHTYLEKKGYAEPFKRVLGKKGAADFEVLLKDILSSEKAYKHLEVAPTEGIKQIFTKYLLPYAFGKTVGGLATGLKLTHAGFQKALRFSLDKPEIAIQWRKAVKELSDGKYAAAKVSAEEFNRMIEKAEKESQTTTP